MLTRRRIRSRTKTWDRATSSSETKDKVDLELKQMFGPLPHHSRTSAPAQTSRAHPKRTNLIYRICQTWDQLTSNLVSTKKSTLQLTRRFITQTWSKTILPINWKMESKSNLIRRNGYRSRRSSSLLMDMTSPHTSHLSITDTATPTCMALHKINSNTSWMAKSLTTFTIHLDQTLIRIQMQIQEIVRWAGYHLIGEAV